METYYWKKLREREKKEALNNDKASNVQEKQDV